MLSAPFTKLTWHLIFFLLVHSAGEGVSEGNGSKEHLDADDKVLPACCHGSSADLLSINEQRIGNDTTAFQDGKDHSYKAVKVVYVLGQKKKNKRQEGELTLPEGQEDDRFDCEELEYWFIRPEQVTSGEEEEEEGVEGQTH